MVRHSGARMLSPDWGTWFPRFQIARHASGDTVLAGRVVDQAEFYGVMSRARDLGLAIIRVERHGAWDTAE